MFRSPQKEADTQENEIKTKTPEIEPLLQETTNQYVIFPINHDDMWTMYKGLVGNFWSVTETLEDLDSLNLDYNEKKVRYFQIKSNNDSFKSIV